MKEGFSVNKSTLDVYYIRPKGHHCGWADISIDEGKESGRLSISSDYGDWTYYWNSCGCSFKEFLCSLNLSYTAGKFGAAKYFDIDSTIKEIKEDILSQRREEDLTAEEAKEFWSYIPDLSGYTNSEHFAVMFYNSPLMKMYDCGPDMKTTIDPSFGRFWDTTWQIFISELKKEIEVINQSATEVA